MNTETSRQLSQVTSYGQLARRVRAAEHRGQGVQRLVDGVRVGEYVEEVGGDDDDIGALGVSMCGGASDHA